MHTHSPKIKRLFVDIETAPNLGFFWDAGYKKTIGYENIVKERAIICVGYKWEHESEVHHLAWDAKQDDKKLLETLVKVLDEADEIVAHNGDRFDLPWIRTRCIKYSIPMQPSYKTIDTIKISKNRFRFNSNRLDYIAKFLGVGEKIHTEYQLWIDTVLHKSKEALENMIKYCKNDVLILEKVYQKLAAYTEPKTHVGVLNGGNKTSCPSCGCPNSVSKGRSVSAVGHVKQVRKCRECGRKFRISLSLATEL